MIMIFFFLGLRGRSGKGGEGERSLEREGGRFNLVLGYFYQRGSFFLRGRESFENETIGIFEKLQLYGPFNQMVFSSILRSHLVFELPARPQPYLES